MIGDGKYSIWKRQHLPSVNGKKNANWFLCHNSRKLTVALSWAHYHEFLSWHTRATTGTILWLITAIEPLKCARFPEEQRVILRQADREDSLQTCWRTTCQQSLQHVFWSSFFVDRYTATWTSVQHKQTNYSSCILQYTIHSLICSVLLNSELHESLALHLSL